MSSVTETLVCTLCFLTLFTALLTGTGSMAASPTARVITPGNTGVTRAVIWIILSAPVTQKLPCHLTATSSLISPSAVAVTSGPGDAARHSCRGRYQAAQHSHTSHQSKQELELL
ncbi:hypothetical protein O3P69_001319 [Scylla paramamosain]|uniref:Secreted protein n=1 Tax=Scylla paramamosain TaxID=85552 RepID=A0AAW0UPU0_SCYPA